MAECEAPVYKSFDFPTAAEALAEIRRQYEAGEPLVWTGPDHLHHVISAGCPEPSACFSPEGLAYDAERGRDFWDVYTMIAFQLGYHAGTLREEAHSKRNEENAEFWRNQYLHEAKRNEG